jgi:hypothetical protein
MAQVFHYDSSPSTYENALTLEEARAIEGVEAKSFAKDEHRFSHYTHRVVVTIERYREQARNMQRHVEELRVSKRGGVSSSLSPMDAVKFMSEEQLASVVGGVAREQIESASRQRREAHEVHRASVAVFNELKLAIGSVVDNPLVDQATRLQLSKMLESFAGSGLDAPVIDAGLEELFGE